MSAKPIEHFGEPCDICTKHRDRKLTHQLVVRVSPALREALHRDAIDSGRTEAQSVRFLLRRALDANSLSGGDPHP